ncbi:MAG TPA: nitroreductase [Anaerolineae bacterium]|nr:nitroreductase [Anaerolineae bacterium]
MDIFEAIYKRHSIGHVKPDPVSRELIEKILGAGVQAPNHYKVRPWQFIVLTGSARERLGEVLAHSLHRRNPETNEEALSKERHKPMRAPVLIAVGVHRPGLEKVLDIENIVAVSSAMQNMQLAAHALGLASMIRTGELVNDPHVKDFLGLAHDQHLLGIIYIGHPTEEHVSAERPSFEDRTTWLE